MKKILKGIALILFGILLCVFGVASKDLFSGDYSYVFSVIGAIVGAIGLVYALFDFQNEKKER